MRPTTIALVLVAVLAGCEIGRLTEAAEPSIERCHRAKVQPSALPGDQRHAFYVPPRP